jgi:hypothetical protein
MMTMIMMMMMMIYVHTIIVWQTNLATEGEGKLRVVKQSLSLFVCHFPATDCSYNLIPLTSALKQDVLIIK